MAFRLTSRSDVYAGVVVLYGLCAGFVAAAVFAPGWGVLKVNGEVIGPSSPGFGEQLLLFRLGTGGGGLVAGLVATSILWSLLKSRPMLRSAEPANPAKAEKALRGGSGASRPARLA